MIGLMGAVGSGKDTVAAMLPGYLPVAFADGVREEICEAFDVPLTLFARDTKELPSDALMLANCKNMRFVQHLIGPSLAVPQSPRQIMKWWGEWRRDYYTAAYWVNRAAERLTSHTIFTDVRHLNEAALVRDAGGELWEVRRQGADVCGLGLGKYRTPLPPDRVIVNDGSMEDLRRAVLK